MQFDCTSGDLARHAATRIDKVPAGPIQVADGDELALEVTCGQNTACLYMSRLQLGSKGTCVLFDNAWLTPNEFQYVSGRETAKDWKRSIKHFGKSLKVLIAKGILLTSPVRCNCGQCGTTPKDKTKSRDDIRPTTILTKPSPLQTGGSTINNNREDSAVDVALSVHTGPIHPACNVPEDRTRVTTTSAVAMVAPAGSGGGVCHQISAISPPSACQKSSSQPNGCSSAAAVLPLLDGASFTAAVQSSCKESSKKSGGGGGGGIGGGGGVNNSSSYPLATSGHLVDVNGKLLQQQQHHQVQQPQHHKTKRSHHSSATSSSGGGQQSHHQHHHHHHKQDEQYSSHSVTRDETISRSTSSVNKSSVGINDGSCSKSTKQSSSLHHSANKSFTDTTVDHDSHHQRNQTNNNNNNNNGMTSNSNTLVQKSQEKSKEQQQQSLQHASSPHYNSNIRHGTSPAGNANGAASGCFETPFLFSPYYPMLATPQLPPSVYYNNPYVMWPAMSAASAFTNSASTIPYSWTAPSTMSESAQDGRSLMNNSGKSNPQLNSSSCALPMFGFPWMKRPYPNEASTWPNIVPGIASQFRGDVLGKHKIDDEDVCTAKQPCLFPNDGIRQSFFGDSILQDPGMNSLMPGVHSSYIPSGADARNIFANNYMKGAESHYDNFNRYPNWFSSPFVGMSSR